MRKSVAVPAAALSLVAFLAVPAAVYACSGMTTAQTDDTQTAQTLIPTTPTSTGSAPMTLKPETSTN